MSIMVHQRPGVYSTYDASAVVSGRGAGRLVGLAAVNTAASPGEVQIVTSYDRAVALFGSSGPEDMAELIRLALKNGASGVAAVAVSGAEDYEEAFALLAGVEDIALVICDSTGRVQGFDSKHDVRTGWYHNCVNAGFYLLDKTVCERVPEERRVDLEKELLAELIARGESVYAYRSSEYIKDVGTVERITAAEEELRSGYIAKRSLRNRQRAIFLDRDGTVNRKNGLVYREEQLALEDGVVEAIREINRSGYLAILVTNQPVVARGLCSVEDVENIHKKLETLLGREGVYLEDIRFCPHHPDKGYPEENPTYKIPCHCRKPDIGMLEECAERYNIDLEKSWMVGDTTMDIQTGKNAGTRTALVLTGDAGKDGKYNAKPDLVCKDLGQAVKMILEG